MDECFSIDVNRGFAKVIYMYGYIRIYFVNNYFYDKQHFIKKQLLDNFIFQLILLEHLNYQNRI
jgi:hypothetical protein